MGTKLDKRDKQAEQGRLVVSHEEGLKLKRQVETPCQYIECSYKTLEGVQTLMEKMVREGRRGRRRGGEWQLARTCKFL